MQSNNRNSIVLNSLILHMQSSNLTHVLIIINAADSLLLLNYTLRDNTKTMIVFNIEYYIL